MHSERVISASRSYTEQLLVTKGHEIHRNTLQRKAPSDFAESTDAHGQEARIQFPFEFQVSKVTLRRRRGLEKG